MGCPVVIVDSAVFICSCSFDLLNKTTYYIYTIYRSEFCNYHVFVLRICMLNRLTVPMVWCLLIQIFSRTRQVSE
jgi:hypothetical protein